MADETLARTLYDAHHEAIYGVLYPDADGGQTWDSLDPSSRSVWIESARIVADSDWLAEDRAQTCREALSEAAQGLSDKMRFFEPASEMDIGFYDAHMSIVRTLRQRAEAVGGDG